MALTKASQYVINDVANTSISGLITSGQIASVANTQVTGLITSGQIASVANTQVTGVLNADQLASALDLSSKTVTLAATFAKTDTVQTYTSAQRVEIGTLTDGATITPDFADTNNFTVTLGGNRTMANPSNIVAGQSGSIFIVQDGTGSRTLSWGSYWDFVDNTAPTLTTTASAVDRVDYIVRSSTSIQTVVTLNYS